MTKSVNIFLRFYQYADFVAKPKQTEPDPFVRASFCRLLGLTQGKPDVIHLGLSLCLKGIPLPFLKE